MNDRCLVTGAGGFIGSRLVASLRDSGRSVRAVVRRTVGAGGAMAGVELARGDVRDLASLQRATKGCSVVFHCAWGGATLEDAREINVTGTRHVLMASAEAGVRRVVHLSSMAVHGHPLPAMLTEGVPLARTGDPYVVSKAAGEREALEMGAKRGVEVVVLRPTLVYGPRSPIWLLHYFDRVRRERIRLPGDGLGLANLVYVDDLIQCMTTAAEQPDIAGEVFLVSGAAPVTWREYIGALARMCGKPVPLGAPVWLGRMQTGWLKVYSALTDRPLPLTAADLNLMSQCCHVRIDKARRLLGYTPAVSLEDGMQRCERWLRAEGYLPSGRGTIH